MFSLDDRGRETDEPKEKREDFRDSIKTFENSLSAKRATTGERLKKETNIPERVWKLKAAMTFM